MSTKYDELLAFRRGKIAFKLGRSRCASLFLGASSKLAKIWWQGQDTEHRNETDVYHPHNETNAWDPPKNDEP